MNHCPTYGKVYLLRERHTKKLKSIPDSDGQPIPIDGHVAYDADGEKRIAIRCFQWDRGFPGDRSGDVRQTNIMKGLVERMLESGDVDELACLKQFPGDERGVEELRQSSKYYDKMTRDEMEDFVSEGMIVHPEKPDYLTCSIHFKPNRVHFLFQSLASLRSHRDSIAKVDVVDPSVDELMKEEASKVKGVWTPCAGTASSSSSQPPPPVPFAGFGTSRPAALDVSGPISPDILDFCVAFADLWRLTGSFARSWSQVPDILLRVPPLLQPIMSKVRVGRSQHLSWDTLCNALRTCEFNVEGKTVDDMVQVADEWIRVGTLLGLFAQAFKLCVQEICVQDQKSSTSFLLAIVATMNTHSFKSGSEMRIRCQWHQGHVHSIKLEPRFAHAPSKYRHTTWRQREVGLLQGRSRRAVYRT